MTELKKTSSKKTVAEKKASLTLPTIGVSVKKNIAVAPDLFDVVASPKLLSQYTRVYLNNIRRARPHAKTRSEVTGSTRKIYRQKGTGRARHGDKQAPIFVGGGKAHGPVGNSAMLSLTKKQRRKALLYALSLKRLDGVLFIGADYTNATGKTKDLMPVVTLAREKGKKILFVGGGDREMLARMGGNIPGVKVVSAQTLNAYTVLNSGVVIFTQSGLTTFDSLRMKKNEN